MQKMTRDELIAQLAQDEANRLDEGDMINVLIDGCAGWNSFTNDELLEAAADHLWMGNDIEIVEE